MGAAKHACERLANPMGAVHRLLRKTLPALSLFSILCFEVPIDDHRLPPVNPSSGIRSRVRGMGMPSEPQSRQAPLCCETTATNSGRTRGSRASMWPAPKL
ncbi:hypothetical protein MUK42_32722 [Musa troglodytarum]|uniref:Uncharacterized protein n=1 Tax=Musa troglodytarum TaxID=320322 RepID=A0A9E7FE84_9LILI|nr:hypothetical protein MUK42_32722 [Musa troglodytarum]